MNTFKTAFLLIGMASSLTFQLAMAQEAAPERVNDFPTVDRVEYVHICQRDNADRPPHEMLYKCSCVIDSIAKTMSYDEFVESSTAFYATSIAGERGQVIRNESSSRGLADRFKSTQVKAKKSCFVEH